MDRDTYYDNMDDKRIEKNLDNNLDNNKENNIEKNIDDSDFLKRKNIIISPKRYLHDSMSAMGIALFSSMVIGLIFSTIGEQLENLVGANAISDFLTVVGGFAISMMGPAIGIAVAYSLEAPMLVVVSTAAVGQMGAEFTGFGIETVGGPGGAFLASIVGAEFGKLISKETKFDNLLTPAVCLIMGGITAKFVGPLVGFSMEVLGEGINVATGWNLVISSVIISVVMGVLLTFPPVSSAAFAIMLGLSGYAAGAATVGCCAQMIGFAACSFRANGFPGVITQGIGTSMIQMPNIMRNPAIWIPPTLTAAIMGPISTVFFHMTNNSEGAGMGTSGLVGQIMTFSDMGFTWEVFGKVMLLHIVMPAVIAIIINRILIKMGYIKPEDYDLFIHQKH